MKLEHFNRRKVLVIDDNLDAAETLCLLMDAVGYDAVFRTDGASGLALAKLWLPDAVLLDIGMPIMNGYQVAMEIRKDNSLDCCRVIALTAWTDQPTVELTTSSGFDVHIGKPASLSAIVKAVEGPGRSLL